MVDADDLARSTARSSGSGQLRPPATGLAALHRTPALRDASAVTDASSIGADLPPRPRRPARAASRTISRHQPSSRPRPRRRTRRRHGCPAAEMSPWNDGIAPFPFVTRSTTRSSDGIALSRSGPMLPCVVDVADHARVRERVAAAAALVDEDDLPAFGSPSPEVPPVAVVAAVAVASVAAVELASELPPPQPDAQTAETSASGERPRQRSRRRLLAGDRAHVRGDVLDVLRRHVVLERRHRRASPFVHALDDEVVARLRLVEVGADVARAQPRPGARGRRRSCS